MKLKSDRKNYVIMALCAILLVMSIGYAAFSSLLTINGTASLSDSFCVGFDNTKLNTYTPTAGITNGTLPTGSMTYSGTACSTKYQPNSSLSATFKQPGDKIEYTLTIANKSTFTVAIESILVENQNVTSNTTITKGNIKYIVEMPLSTTLASNAETTMKITAMFQNDTAVTGQYSGESQTINVKINAEQGDSGFTPTPAAFTGTIYRWSTTMLANKGSSSASYFPITIANLTKGTDYIIEADYPTYSARATALGKQYYIKQDIANNEIINSYVCFISDEEHCMKGGDNGASLATNTQIIQDYQTYFDLGAYFNGTGCDFDSSYSRCFGGGFERVGVGSSGGVYVYGSSSEGCIVDSTGYSGCFAS